MTEYRNKKVLVFGLGLLGGGVATVNWLVQRGAHVTVTDLKSRKELASSIAKIIGKIKYRLGGHTHDDIKTHDIIVVNPDVSIKNPLIQYALKIGKIVQNEATIFHENFPGDIVAITGTRGKTTTTLWANHLLGGMPRSSIAGNSTASPYLKILGSPKKSAVAVTEVSPKHLELFPTQRVPDIAIITNLSPDHLNRHGTLENYAAIKARIFRNQTLHNALILNANNRWTKFFLRQKPKSRIFFFSLRPLSRTQNGLFLSGKNIYFKNNGGSRKVFLLNNFTLGEHNIANLLAATLAAHLAGCSWQIIAKSIQTLPQPSLRQEVVFKNKKLIVVNDTTATSPEGTVAAIKRFKSPSSVFIFGGTDRQLIFDDWAREVRKNIAQENVFFLAGSATNKMLAALKWRKISGHVFSTLKECIQAALTKSREYPRSFLVFSPAAKSFEKFKNEYDRGEQFTRVAKKLIAHV